MANVPGTPLPEVIGTGGADVLNGRGDAAVFGGRGDDTFRAARTGTGQYLAGGSGADLYVVPAGATVVVTEGFGYQGDVVRAPAIDLDAPTGFTAEIDGRHLLIGDAAADTNVVLLDWLDPDKRVETLDLAGGAVQLGVDLSEDDVRAGTSYLGDFTLEELVREGRLPAGLGDTFDRDLVAAIYARADRVDHGGRSGRVDGTAGADVLGGGPGDDGLFGFAGDDTLRARGGNDGVYGGPGDDTMEGGGGDDGLFGGTGNDALKGQGGADGLFGFGGNDALDGGPDDDGLFGGPGDDVLHGRGGGDGLFGADGDDRLHGGIGTDGLFGGPGNDDLTGAAGDDGLFAGAGDDLLLGKGGTDGLFGGSGGDRLFGGVGPDLLNGGIGDDVLHGGFGADVLIGLAGRNQMAGGPGDDTYHVGRLASRVVERADEGTDTVLTGRGYTLPANVENLTLTGGAAANAVGNALDNRLTGNGGGNGLFGRAGDDVLDGGGGDDAYIGGLGADTFVIGAGGGADRVGDFTPGEDVLRLVDLLDPGGNPIAAFGDLDTDGSGAVSEGDATASRVGVDLVLTFQSGSVTLANIGSLLPDNLDVVTT